LIIGGIAGAIIAVGGAFGQLGNWVRGAAHLVRRLRRRRAAKHKIPDAPTQDQVRVLNAAHRYFLEQGTPATFRQLDKLLDREGVQLRPHAESMPPGLLTPDISRRGGAFHADDELIVTVEGLRYCEEGMATLDLLARVLAFMARREKAFMPTPTQPDLVIDAAEVGKELRLSARELDRVRLLVHRFAPQVWNMANSGTSGDWRFTVNLEGVRPFRGVRDGNEYLLARDGAQSFAHRLDEANRPRFTLVGEVPGFEFGAGPICLRVENEGPTDEFEAFVVAVQFAARAAPPWHVRWRGSQERGQEILTGHHWLLEICDEPVSYGEDDLGGARGWRFLRPDGESLVIPDQVGANDPFTMPVRVTIKVTPRSHPTCALEYTVSVRLNDRGRSVEWDHYRVPPQ
jgi:hypothetical protein